jgi:hypothetical protein
MNANRSGKDGQLIPNQAMDATDNAFIMKGYWVIAAIHSGVM